MNTSAKRFLVLLLFIACTCSLQAQSPGYTVAFYNLENLFDTVDSPDTDDAEFLPAAGWTAERYQKKLRQIARVIDTLGVEGGPNFLGVCEVENRGVLSDLTGQKLLKDQSYRIVHEESGDPRGIDVAFLYQKKSFKEITHRAFRLYMPDTQLVRTRDVLWVLGKINNDDTVGFFICHWPSRRGAERAEKYRAYIGDRIREMTDSLSLVYPGATWILMGDLNDEPLDASVSRHLGAIGLQEEACSENKWYNAMLALQEKGDGTHSYQQKWNMLDQILLHCPASGSGGFRIADKSASVYRPKWMQSTHAKYYGEPYRTFAGKNYLGGFSDHFPVWVTLIKQ